jgi:hypothetical protein
VKGHPGLDGRLSANSLGYALAPDDLSWITLRYG